MTKKMRYRITTQASMAVRSHASIQDITNETGVIISLEWVCKQHHKPIKTIWKNVRFRDTTRKIHRVYLAYPSCQICEINFQSYFRKRDVKLSNLITDPIFNLKVCQK